MPRILQWTENELSGLAKAFGLSRIAFEVGDDGLVSRELGFDAEGNIVHRFPGQPTRAEYGVFDLAKFDLAGAADLEPEEFERLWLA